MADPPTAIWADALVGGSPGYRDLIAEAPQRLSDLPLWPGRTFRSPSHALYREDDYLLSEDPRLRSRSLYSSIPTAIAAGAPTPTRIGAVVGRPATALAAPLHILERAGLVGVGRDLLLQRRPLYQVEDPVMRTLRLPVRPRETRLEARRASEVWDGMAATLRSQILGPHFEHLARERERRFASEATTGGPLGLVGRTVVNDPGERARHEVDVVGLAAGGVGTRRSEKVAVIGEAKASGTRLGVSELARLERIGALLAARGHDLGGARIHLFGLSGFSAELHSLAASRGDLELIDPRRLYSGD